MAEVFNAKTVVPRRVADPGKDHKLPSLGGLNLKQIATVEGVKGTKGADCMKVTGGRWQQMDGNLTENYSGSKTIEIQGDYVEKVMGNYTQTVDSNADCAVKGNSSEKVVGNYSQQVQGNFGKQVQGKYNKTVVGNYNFTVTSGSLTRTVAAGNVMEKVAFNHTAVVGIGFSVSSTVQSYTAVALLSINGALVKINT